MMKNIKNLMALIFTGILFCVGCTKEENRKGCWQASFRSGGDVAGLQLCDRTKGEAEAEFPNYLFYNAKEKKYCWKLQNYANTSIVTYYKDVPQSIADIAFKSTIYGYTKIDCNSFCGWKVIEKRKSKTTNQFKPAMQFFETFTNPDTCRKLFEGRVIVFQETADSIITREFSQKP